MKRISLILVVLCACILTGCKTTKEVVKDAEQIHDTLFQNVIRLDTLYKTMYKLDSIFLHDSIYEKEYLKGDTLVQYKYVEQTKYLDRVKYDTLYRTSVRRDTTYIAKTDTVTKVDIKQVVKTPLSNGLKWFAVGLVIGASAAIVIKVKIFG